MAALPGWAGACQSRRLAADAGGWPRSLSGARAGGSAGPHHRRWWRGGLWFSHAGAGGKGGAEGRGHYPGGGAWYRQPDPQSGSGARQGARVSRRRGERLHVYRLLPSAGQDPHRHGRVRHHAHSRGAGGGGGGHQRPQIQCADPRRAGPAGERGAGGRAACRQERGQLLSSGGRAWGVGAAAGFA